MPNAIYVNMLVGDLPRAKQFFVALGFSFNEQFTNDAAAGLVISDTIYAMLHTTDSIRRFTKKELVNSHSSTEVLLALQLDSKEEVDQLLDRAIGAGAKQYRETADHGFMYERSFEDLDGHIWEAFWMNPDAFPKHE
ncbi:MAG: VOC family protein [Planctomycetota bacterium]|nr:VOC family protein [Planctomycetota bacterium]